MPELTFDKIMQRLADPNTMTPERLELVRTISQRMAQDPAFLEAVERAFADHDDEIRRVTPEYAELAARATDEPGRPRPAHAAAAIVVAAAIVAGPEAVGPPSPGH
jgi:hypothetical protein